MCGGPPTGRDSALVAIMFRDACQPLGLQNRPQEPCFDPTGSTIALVLAHESFTTTAHIPVHVHRRGRATGCTHAIWIPARESCNSWLWPRWLRSSPLWITPVSSRRVYCVTICCEYSNRLTPRSELSPWRGDSQRVLFRPDCFRRPGYSDMSGTAGSTRTTPRSP